MDKLKMEDVTIEVGAVRVFPRGYYEVLDASTGTPICIATFSSRERAEEYAEFLRKKPREVRS